MVIISYSTKKASNYILTNWVDSEILESIYAFVHKEAFNKDVNNAGPAIDWVLFSPYNGK